MGFGLMVCFAAIVTGAGIATGSYEAARRAPQLPGYVSRIAAQSLRGARDFFQEYDPVSSGETIAMATVEDV